jgi:hypothetical protein
LSLLLLSPSLLLVHAVSARTARPATRPVASRFLLFEVVDRSDMVVLLARAEGVVRVVVVARRTARCR